MAKNRKYRPKTSFQTKIKHFFKWTLNAAFLLAMLAAVAVTLSEALGGPLPTWQDLYQKAGLSTAPHTMADSAGTATKVHFIDVGQADATLVEQDGKFALIDAGDFTAQIELLDYLDKVGVKTIDLLVMTHPHTDHIGGMEAVLKRYRVKQVLLPDFSKAPPLTGYTATSVLSTIKRLKIPTATAKAGDTYALGNGVFEVLSAGIETEDEYNDICVITMFTAKDMRFLSCGDASYQEEADLMDSKAKLSANLYKVAHHGSSNSNWLAWVEEIDPDIAVVSCGLDNDYGHPHKRTLSALHAVDAAIYRTDYDGSCLAYLDANGRLQMAVSKQDETKKQAAA
ncbi:MAG: ComEC/Rec2 family competence protein [Ruthenibacterium sp.]